MIICHRWRPGVRNAPVAHEIIRIVPVADGEACRVGRAERCGLDRTWPQHRDIQDVGLELHQQRVHHHAAIDAQCADGDTGIALHRLDHVERLIRGGFQCGACNVAGGGVARQPGDHAARIGTPVRRIEAGKRRHKIHVAVVGD